MRFLNILSYDTAAAAIPAMVRRSSAAKKNRARALLASRTLIKLGAGRTPRARERAGDLRDAQRVRYLMDHCQEKVKIPAFLTVPTSQWYAPLPPSPSFQGFPRGSRFSFFVDRGRTSVAVLTALCDLLSYILHPVADRPDTSSDATLGMINSARKRRPTRSGLLTSCSRSGKDAPGSPSGCSR